jgi:hypothetical protein
MLAINRLMPGGGMEARISRLANKDDSRMNGVDSAVVRRKKIEKIPLQFREKRFSFASTC